MSNTEVDYIDYKWISDDPVLIAKADQLTELFRADKQPKRKNDRPFPEAFNVILTAMEVSETYSGRSIFIPTNNNLYKGESRRSSPYTTEILDALKWLIAQDYLEKISGIKFTATELGELPRQLPYAYKLSDKWLREIASSPLSSPDLVRRNQAADYVELREKVNKQTRLLMRTAKDLEAHGELINSSEELLRQYDSFMKTIGVSLGCKPILSAMCSMTRIFSRASYECGGRLYCPVQNLKKRMRPYLYFDGEPTIEIDYGSLHPQLLYHQEGLKFSGEDPYEIEGIDRGTVKVAFNTMINRGGKHKPKSAVNAFVRYLKLSKAKAKELEEALLALHSPIKHYFNTGYGLRLQRLDSDIAMKIINHFINVKRRPIIGVHDSFVVSVRDTESLKDLMNDCYNNLFREQNDAVFDAINWLDIADASGVSGVVGMRKVSANCLDFSTSLMGALKRCFAGETDEMGGQFWDDLLAMEPMQEPPS